jgi:lipoprotein-anchoring transpeptidase ErfK/SrfK
LRANSLAIKNTMMESRGLKRLYLYMRRADRRRVLLLLASSFLVLVVVGLIGFLFIQDLALSGQIFPGITIDGKAVGGMSKTEATDLIKRTVAAPLMASMVLVNEDHEYKLDLKSINLSVDVAAMVDKAYAEGKHQNFISRMFRRFGNKPIHRNVPVIFKYDAAKLNSFIARIAGNVDVSARSSSLDMSTGTPVVSSSKYGLRVVRDGTRDAIVAALPSGNRRIPLLVESVKPRVTEEDIGYIIVVRQSEHKLYLYKAGKFVDAFACAVGTPEYPTPTGQFSIVKKEKDPTWYPPKSDWAKDKKPIPPGPGNPLGPYWMAIGDGVGIHSTPDEKSLGYSASHGCIRLSEWSAQYIFNRVSKGTPVYIYP